MNCASTLGHPVRGFTGGFVFFVFFYVAISVEKCLLGHMGFLGYSTLSGHRGRFFLFIYFFLLRCYIASLVPSSYNTSTVKKKNNGGKQDATEERWRRVRGVAPPTWFSLYGLRWCEAHTARMTIMMSRAPQDARMAIRVLLSVGFCRKERKDPQTLPRSIYGKNHGKIDVPLIAAHPRPPTLSSSS